MMAREVKETGSFAKAKLPKLSCFESSSFKNLVYEPSEDTFFFLDALQQDISSLLPFKPGTICLEIGSGSGCIITFLASLLKKVQGKQNHLFFATDINQHATRATSQTAFDNDVFVEVIQTDLFFAMKERMKNKIDILLFNPPYVPSSEEEFKEIRTKALQGEEVIDVAWAGGLHGTQVLDHLLPFLSEILSPCGYFYLVVIEENNPSQIISKLKSQGFHHKILVAKRAANEMLYILKFFKENVTID